MDTTAATAVRAELMSASRLSPVRFTKFNIGPPLYRAKSQPLPGKHQKAGTQSKGGRMKVGFIGLGNMGSGMAANLLKAGHELVVYNRTPAKAHPLVAQGARLAATIADACHGDAVLTMLADDTAVEA